MASNRFALREGAAWPWFIVIRRLARETPCSGGALLGRRIAPLSRPTCFQELWREDNS